ncbi:MAG: DUF1566 domain-containing protein [Prevotellaceae bacterium]|jgi:hypothetical protein|nr:DUF1566 domain-containing protein [Prevotellaceae bacterium]
MKTNLFLFAAFTAAFLSVAPFMAAQVTIGGGTEPKKGAILDLNSTTKGGLLLSNVELTALDEIPATFPNAGAISNPQALAGMIVWNTNDFLAPNGGGLYLWDGNKWNYTGGGDGRVPLPAVDITPTVNSDVATFKISKPTSNDWDTFWDNFSIANITAYLGGDEQTVSATNLSFDGTYYYYTIKATKTNQSNTYIIVGGSVNGVSVTPTTSSKVTVSRPDLPAVDITLSPMSNCRFVKFKISKPAGSEWDDCWGDFSVANITAFLGGSTYSSGTLSFSSPDYYYTITATSTNQSNTYITVSGSVNGVSVTSKTSSKVTVGTTTLTHYLSIYGRDCFDVTDENTVNTRLGSSHSYEYGISSGQRPGYGNISNVVWSYATTPTGTVISSATSGSKDTSKFTLTYDERVNITVGTTVTITAIVTITGANGCTGPTNYTLNRTVTFRDVTCCPGVIIPGGVHRNPPSGDGTFGDGTSYTYAQLIDLGVTRDTAHDLCVYYRHRNDGSFPKWSTANSSCANSDVNVINAEHAYLGEWRLPTIGELGYLQDGSPKHNALSSAQGAYSGTGNMDYQSTGKPYWSSSAQKSGWRYQWSFFTGTSSPVADTNTQRYTRCVKSL